MSAVTTFSILRGMADALPTHNRGDDSSDLASSYEAVALLMHAYLVALDFKLCGFDEDKSLPECVALAPRLPAQWNSGFGSLSFVYSHKQSTMRFVVRIDRMGAKVEVRGLAVGDDNIHRFERSIRDVVDAKALPIRITLNREGQEDRSDLADKLRRVFVSEQAIADLLHAFKVKIVQKLVPKLQQEGCVETAEAEETASSERRAQEFRDPNHPRHGQQPFPSEPLPPRNPLPEMARPRPGAPVPDFPPPGFEDEFELNQPLPGVVLPGRSPYGIGHDDLHPPGLGPHDPLRGSITGGGLPLPGQPSGMHPTFDDPLFTGGPPGGFGSRQGYDPQAPPGARWDPLGPGGPGPRFPGTGSGRGGNSFGGFGPGDII